MRHVRALSLAPVAAALALAAAACAPVFAGLSPAFAPVDRAVLPPTVYLAVVSVPLIVRDCATLRLPNILVLPGYGIAGLGAAWQAAFEPPWVPLAAFGITVAVFLGFRMLGVVGMGDVKLAGLLSATLGLLPAGRVPFVFVTAALASVTLAGLTALVVLAASRSRVIPFGPHLLVGFWVALLWAR